MKKEMYPIRSELKSRRIKFDVPQNTISWAFMKELRENNKTRKIFEVNPYVEVYQFRENLYGLFTENCDGMGDVWMYLIIGPEKAMLIDTAFGLGDLKGLVDTITGGKELIVVNTHDHFDHAYGNCRFDKVYCHEYLVPYLTNQHAHMWDYLFDAWGDNIWLEFDKKDLPQYKPYEIVGVPDGYTWDLGGGYEVELIHTGGHAAGHAAYLDKTGRILFPGDNICSDVSGCGAVGTTRANGPHAECTLMSYYLERVRYLVSRLEEYDYIFPQHFMNNLESHMMLDVLDAVQSIVDEPEKCDYKTVRYGKMRDDVRARCFKYIRGFAPIGYEVGTKK